MKQLHGLILFLLFGILTSCGSNGNDDDYVPLPESPVVMDLNAVPYASLSDYNFFQGELKNLDPVYGVLPYDLNSSLFTDYAQKKRFVWMPAGTKATYSEDGKVLNFPVGTALIKTFYYDAVEAGGQTDVVETRLMIKKASGWIFADYVWNADKTEAILSTQTVDHRLVRWVQDGQVRQTYYKIPTTAQCALCHTVNDQPTAIGPKPQNLNKNYAYAEGSQNQLAKWIAFGYLDTAPANIVSTVDWTDTTKPLELRVRSYLDINCAHCHTDGTYCGYTPMNLAFSKTTTPANFGICREPVDYVTGDQQYIVKGSDVEGSLMHFRMSTNIQSEMMPLIGRTVVDDAALQMMEQWINSLDNTCE
jgi:uncharacterized repeat protein (TIGR03806 family)